MPSQKLTGNIDKLFYVSPTSCLTDSRSACNLRYQVQYKLLQNENTGTTDIQYNGRNKSD